MRWNSTLGAPIFETLKILIEIPGKRHSFFIYLVLTVHFIQEGWADAQFLLYLNWLQFRYPSARLYFFNVPLYFCT